MDRRHTDEQLGYISGKMEALDAKLDSHMDSEEEKIEKLEKRIDNIDEKMDQILLKHNTAKVVWSVVKFLGTVGFLIVTLKMGDIKLAWEIFLKGL